MFVLENGDKIQGDASAATVVDYHISGLTGSTLKNLADGQLAATIGDLYTSAATDLAKTIVLTNTDSVARTINLYHTPSGGTARRILPKDMSLAAGGTILFDGENVSIVGADGAPVGGSPTITDGSLTIAKIENIATDSFLGRDTAGTGALEVLSATATRTILNVEDGADVTDATNVAAAGAVMDADFNANTILAATVDDTPAPLTIAEQTVVGRITGGNIAGLTAAQLKTLTGYLTDVVGDTTPQLGGALSLNEFNIDHVAAPSVNQTSSGNTATFTAGEILAFGQPCYIKSDGKAWKADADGTTPSERGLLIALAAISADAAGAFALPGTIIRDDAWAWTVGTPIYLSATAGTLTQTAASVVVVLGIATHADRMFFYPTIQDAPSGSNFATHKFTSTETWAAADTLGGATIVQIFVDPSLMTVGSLSLQIDGVEVETFTAGGVLETFIKEATGDVDFITSLPNGALVSGDSNANKIYLHAGYTASVVSSFASPSTEIRGLGRTTTDNLVSGDDNNIVYVHAGFTSTISSTFAQTGSGSKGGAVDSSDNFIACSTQADRIYIHTGLTATVTTSFYSPTGNPQGVTVDSSDNIISITGSQKIYLHSGETSTVTTSFSSTALADDGISVDASGNLIVCSGSTIELHTGISSTISSTFASPSTQPTGTTSYPPTFAGSSYVTINY